MAKVAYSAIVLTPESHIKLVTQFRDRVPAGWEIVAHHVTINMGELPPELKASIGLPVKVQVFDWHMDDKVAAVQVIVPSELQGFMKNKYPHITIAVNKAGGGKPVMSNNLIASDLARDEADEIVGGAFTPIPLMGQIQELSNL